ncbi:MAG TPA: chromate transporter [Oxalicibacterium sp.]|uniref:chromate transporter n=1 Tax=Oxalicibacterium sp. TaxID=2766525 RepID=UPI002B648649|nr:chromate transporter [Oxalicibacterium sp.]HWU97168.1 chromate transporter [Oxalicibacterium sp.]
MNETLHLSMHVADWLQLFLHYLSLSLLSVGGAIASAPDMHRYLVDDQHLLTDPQFSASITIAQAAPGPNILFVALMGWNVGLNAGSMVTGLLGMALTMVGMLLPSTAFTYTMTRWIHRNRELRPVRAFKLGMGPVVVGLVLATGWILASAHDTPSQDWPLYLVTLITVVMVLKTRIHLLWLLTAGAVLGWFGLV